MSNIPVLKPQEVARILENLGFVEMRQRGSHKQFRNIDTIQAALAVLDRDTVSLVARA